MTAQHNALKKLAHTIVTRWERAYADPDNQIDGCDAVDSLGCYVDLAKDALAIKEPVRPERVPIGVEKGMTPTYKELVAALGSAVAEWSYLFPETFDDKEHEAQSRKNLKHAERIHTQALRALGQKRRVS